MYQINIEELTRQLQHAEARHTAGALQEAAGLYRRILDQNPGLAYTAYNLGIVLNDLAQYADAETAFRHALTLQPEFPEAELNLSFAIQEQGRYAEAVDGYRRLASPPFSSRNARFNLACLQLLTGDLVQGWEGYELRFENLQPVARRHGDKPLWDGSIQHGARLLIHTEQGYGDAIQMARYLPLLAEAGMEVHLETSPPLASLLTKLPGLESCVVRGAPVPDVDCQAPIMSLPGLMGTTLENIPATLPYLTSENSGSHFWKGLLPDTPKLRVGLAWVGRLDLPVNRKRSLSPALLEPLLDIPDLLFISLLQSVPDGFGTNDPRILSFPENLHAFHDTAALIANLDLVITIDTAVAHLAGAMGTPTWLLLPFVPDWRWLLERDDSPWYPSMRLFRQPAPGDWGSVIERVQHELRQYLRSDFGKSHVAHMPNHFKNGTDDTADHLFQAGLTLLQEGNSREAADTFRRLLALDPNLAEAWHNLGHACDAEYPNEAEHAFRTARRLSPNDSDIACSLADLYTTKERFEDALMLYREILASHPGDLAALNGAGVACQRLCRADEARHFYEELLRHSPDDPDALNNLGVLFREGQDLAASRRCFEAVLAKSPEEGDARWNLSHTLLIAGELKQGWDEYEWRFRRTAQLPLPQLPLPRWEGEALRGRSILLWTEQAYGDTFQFIRYAVLLANQGARVIVAVQDDRIGALLATASGVHAVVRRDQPLPPADCWIPLLSLPRLFGTIMDTIPVPVPYLHPPADSRETWQRNIPSADALRIGLVWAGRSRPDPRRSCPPDQLLPLTTFRDRCRWYSLQVEADPAQLDMLTSALRLTDLAPLLTDFGATAAAICSLDLVITIDTSVAHLAGALGVPTWLMLPYAPDWRWLLQRQDSPWYPSMRIFRQPAPGDWSNVADRICEALNACCAGQVDDATDLSEVTPLLDGIDRAKQEERWQEALNLCLSLLSRVPRHPLALLQAGGCLLFLRQPLAARRFLELALARDTEQVDAHINLALACLTSGDYATGWREFEWRLRKISDPLPPMPLLPAPGVSVEALRGAVLLVHTEQGFGDTLQFVRYLPQLANLGLRVILSAPPSMTRLLANLGGDNRIIPHGDILPPADYQAFLLSVPLIVYEVQPEPLDTTPYLAPPADLAAQWASRLPDDGYLRVGLVWAGREMAQSGYRRSLTLRDCAPLLRLPGATFVSLQTGPRAADIGQQSDANILDCSMDISDFADTAAIIAQLDLVITIDTSVAHLAGAMGKPTWVALLHAPDWRWGLDGEETAWYPSMRLFRQSESGSWDYVIARIETSLLNLLVDHLTEQSFARYHRRDLSGAIPLFSALLSYTPGNLDARFCLATSLLQCNQPEQAETHFRQLLAEAPSAEVYNNLGHAVGNQGRRNDAIAAFEQAVILEPATAESWQNLGNHLHAAGRRVDARQALHRAAALTPDSPEVWQNLGLVHQGLGELDDAYTCFRRALALHPGHEMARWNLGLLLLLRDDYQEGFPLLEARFVKPGALLELHADIPRWRGEEIAGKSLLVHAEQGFGDTIQFIRYVPLLAGRGARVVVEIQHEALRRLISTVPGIVELIVRGERRPEIDMQIPMFSLPLACGTTTETIPQPPYLVPPPETLTKWRDRISTASSGNLRVGIVWRGRSTPDPGRSIPVQELAPIFRLPGICWYSLQVDDEAHLETPPEVCLEHTTCLTDFAETAACIACLDLVLTIDSAVAHLAGALGIPGIVMLQAVPDWRWGLCRAESIWYPSLRLVRQGSQGIWGGVVEEVARLIQFR